jgi:hypothetical protein
MNVHVKSHGEPCDVLKKKLFCFFFFFWYMSGCLGPLKTPSLDNNSM